jgi:hypothetical protein
VARDKSPAVGRLMYRPRMHRFVWGLLVCAACGVEKDDRPLELDYLTQAIFAPSCGATQCHSTFKQEANLVFDEPWAARRTLLDNGLIRFDSTHYDPVAPSKADLIIWITEIFPFGGDIPRMPLDAPLPNKDVLLLQEWIEAGAPGAQCDPDANGGMACNDKEVVQCNADWSFGARVQLCSGDCIAGRCR